MCFAVVTARRHPGLNVMLSDLTLSEVSRANINDAVREAEVLQAFLSVGQKFVMIGFRSCLIGLTDDDLLDFLELMNAVEA